MCVLIVLYLLGICIYLLMFDFGDVMRVEFCERPCVELKLLYFVLVVWLLIQATWYS